VATRVYFEEGKSSVFAAAIDWPGWCRRAKSRDAALEALLDYQGRYAAVLSMPFKPGTFEVVGAVPGNATTDFGAPDRDTPWDDEAITSQDLKRQVAVLVDCWTYFDGVVDAAPATLTKGRAAVAATATASFPTSKRPSVTTARNSVRACPRERHGSNSVRWSLRRYSPDLQTARGPRGTRFVVSPGTSWITRGRSRTRACRTILTGEYSYPRDQEQRSDLMFAYELPDHDRHTINTQQRRG